MACVDKRRVVQYVGSPYDEQAQPTGQLLPILFKYTVEITDEEK